MSATDDTLGFSISYLHGTANFVGAKQVKTNISEVTAEGKRCIVAFSVVGIDIEFRATVKPASSPTGVLQRLEYRNVHTMGEWVELDDGFYLTDGVMVHRIFSYDRAFLRRGSVPLLPSIEDFPLYQVQE